MQPIMMITSRQEGIVHINGAFSGEVRPNAPLFRPVSAYGAVYIEFSPLTPGVLSVARRITLSAGKPVEAAFDSMTGLSAISWPFGVTEIELLPEKIYRDFSETRIVSGAGREIRLLRSGEKARVEIDAAGRTYSYSLPDGAEEPAVADSEGLLLLSGSAGPDSRYALALSPDAGSELALLSGREIAFLGNRRVALAEEIGDIAGHIRRTVYAISEEGAREESSEILPNAEREFQAATPEECALAAAECAQAGLTDESKMYFAPGSYIDESALSLLSETAACARLRFSPPDGRTAIGALKTVRPSLAIASPVYYHAEIVAGAWRITDMRACNSETDKR